MSAPTAPATGSRLLIAHPSADLYGSDLQLLETVRAMDGWDVVTVLPAPGPLVHRLEEAGSRVLVAPFPVLRKSLLTPRGAASTAVDGTIAARRIRRLLRRARPACVLVNTVTIPEWIAGARAAGIPSLVHVHEAENTLPAPLQTVLNAPLLASDAIVANSASSRDVLVTAVPALAERITVIHNGVTGPTTAPTPPRTRSAGDPVRVVYVGRLSPRKGVDVALDAVGLLRERGHAVHLDVAGSVFEGYEWFERELRDRAARPDLDGAVAFHGYVSPSWPLLETADVVVVPSRQEPFGNAAVEALLAHRPLVASDVQGLAEIVRPGVTGLLAAPGDAEALASSLGRLVDTPREAVALADAGWADATARFSPATYHEGIRAAVLAATTTTR